MGEDEVTVVRSEWEATQERLRDLEELVGRLAAVVPLAPAAVEPAPPTPEEVAPAQPTSRRRALIGMAAAGAGAAALVAGQASPAAANGQGQSFTLGDNTNTATATTGVTSSSGGGPAVRGTNSASGIGVYGVSGPASAIAASPAGVTGDSQDQAGVLGLSKNGTGVSAFSQSGVGIDAAALGYPPNLGTISTTVAAVRAQSTSKTGLVAISQDGVAVRAHSQTSRAVSAFSAGEIAISAVSLGPTSPAIEGNGSAVGVLGRSETGWGVVATSNGRAPLRLEPSGLAGLRDVFSKLGEIYVDGEGEGRLWACVKDGTPGTWRVMAGPKTAGALHVLPAPVRVYDSRPGTLPAVGLKTKFAANATRTIDLKANGSTVPEGARAALLTLLLVNASSTPGNATIWANGSAKPQANTMVWGGTGGRFTAAATSAVDDYAQIWVNVSQPSDVVIDVVGYYR